MKKKELAERCLNIFHAFVSVENYSMGPGDILGFIDDTILKLETSFLQDNIIEKAYEQARRTNKKRDLDFARKMENAVSNLKQGRLPACFFAFGYAMGQMVDITDTEIQEDVKMIQKAIKKEALLPYLPRKERRAP